MRVVGCIAVSVAVNICNSICMGRLKVEGRNNVRVTGCISVSVAVYIYITLCVMERSICMEGIEQ